MKTWGNKRKKTLNLNWFLSRRLPPSLGKNQKWPSPTFAKKNQKHRGRPLLFENNRGHLPPFGLGKAKERTKAAPIFSFSHTSRPPSPFWPWKSKRENQGSPYFLLLTYQPAAPGILKEAPKTRSHGQASLSLLGPAIPLSFGNKKLENQKSHSRPCSPSSSGFLHRPAKAPHLTPSSEPQKRPDPSPPKKTQLALPPAASSPGHNSHEITGAPLSGFPPSSFTGLLQQTPPQRADLPAMAVVGDTAGVERKEERRSGRSSHPCV